MAETVKDLGTDIRDISRTPPLFSPVATTLFGSRWYESLYLFSIFICILLIVLIRLVARRNADISLVQNRHAGKAARSRLKKADRFRKANKSDSFYEEIGKALWEYLSHKMTIETSGLTRDVVLEKMKNRNVPEELRKELIRILEDSEFSRFAPTSERSDMDRLYGDAVQLIRNLENSLK